MTKVLGILGTSNKFGITAQMLQAVLAGAKSDGCDVEMICLADYPLEMNPSKEHNQILDQLHHKMLASECLIFATPTYWKDVSGLMKQFLDCMRSRMVRFGKKDGEMLPDLYAKKKYILLTNCYTKTLENCITGVTDSTFIVIDRVCTTAGMELVGEAVTTNTFAMKELPDWKHAECVNLGKKIQISIEKRDFTVKRYIQLFFMLAFSTLITMGIQSLIENWLPITGFWGNYVTFVLIFFILLSVVLHYFSVKKHKRN